ncbi:MAG: hypothetical protein ACR2OJ_12330 [Hyphomicrobiales bacterium]
MDDTLNSRILKEHEKENYSVLADLYKQAGEMAEAHDEIDEACFFFTTAYVFALDTGQTSLCADLHEKLLNYGREE